MLYAVPFLIFLVWDNGHAASITFKGKPYLENSELYNSFFLLSSSSSSSFHPLFVMHSYDRKENWMPLKADRGLYVCQMLRVTIWHETNNVLTQTTGRSGSDSAKSVSEKSGVKCNGFHLSQQNVELITHFWRQWYVNRIPSTGDNMFVVLTGLTPPITICTDILLFPDAQSFLKSYRFSTSQEIPRIS